SRPPRPAYPHLRAAHHPRHRPEPPPGPVGALRLAGGRPDGIRSGDRRPSRILDQARRADPRNPEAARMTFPWSLECSECGQTRAAAAGATRFVVPTAGNAGIALAAYAARAGVRARVYAPQTTPATILAQIRSFGAELLLLDGHIGDCGKAARQFAAESGAVDV